MSEKRWALKMGRVPWMSDTIKAYTTFPQDAFEEVTVPGPGEVIVPVVDLRSLLDWLDLHVGHCYPLDRDSYVDVIRQDLRTILLASPPQQPADPPAPRCPQHDMLMVLQHEPECYWYTCPTHPRCFDGDPQPTAAEAIRVAVEDGGCLPGGE